MFECFIYYIGFYIIFIFIVYYIVNIKKSKCDYTSSFNLFCNVQPKLINPEATLWGPMNLQKHVFLFFTINFGFGGSLDPMRLLWVLLWHYEG